MTGYPSIDKPWLKYYSDEALKRNLIPNTIYGYLWEHNREHLDDIALVYFERKITYRTLFKEIEQCAASLQALGLKPGDIVTIQALAVPQLVVLLYAISKVGAVANLIYVTSTETEVNRFLKRTDSQMYFVLDDVYEKFVSVLEGTCVKKVVLLSVGTEMDMLTGFVYHLTHGKKCAGRRKVMSWNAFMKSGIEACVEVPVDEQRPVAMVYTGGTTGVSKAVVLTNHSINALAFQYENAEMGFVRQEMFMDTLPPFIAFGITVSLHIPLCQGLKTVLIPDPGAANAAKQFLKYKPNYYVASPAQISAILHQPKAQKLDFSFLKILGAGGDALPISEEQHINDFLLAHNCLTAVCQGYGMSELAATVCTGKPGVIRKGTVGIPLPEVEIKICDMESGRELSYGQQGELCIMAPSVMAGYYKDAEETEKVLKQHEDGRYWIHTGDIGKMDPDGFLMIVGRIKRMICVLEGAVYYKVFPKLLEEQFEKLSGVTSVIVVGNSTCWEECDLVAFIVAEQEQPVTEEELRAFAAEKFEVYEQPMEYRFLSELPRTKLGKVDYRKLEQMASEKVCEE